MTKSKKTKKALLASVLSIMLCVAMLAGTTFAWFTDTAGSDDNRIKSGNLRINLVGIDKDGNDEELSADALFGKDTQWEPGKVHYKQLKVVNEGNLAAKFRVDLNGDAFQMNYRVDPTDEESGYVWTEHNLTEVIKVAVYEGTFADLVAEINKLKEETIDEEGNTIVDLLLAILSDSDENAEPDSDPDVEPLADEGEDVEAGSEGTGESAELDWEKWNAAYREEIAEKAENGSLTEAEWGEYAKYVEAALESGDLVDNEDIFVNSFWLLNNSTDSDDIKLATTEIANEVIRQYRVGDNEANNEEKKLQVYRAAVASLQVHSGKEYNEMDRDVVTVALALYDLGMLEKFKVEENFAETTLFEGTLAPKGEEKKVTVGEGEDKTEETLKDNKVFTLIAFWPEGGESDNKCNLKNGRRATELMSSETAAEEMETGEIYVGKIEKELQIEFDILVLATQAPVETDSFDENYDFDAEWPTLATEAVEP